MIDFVGTPPIMKLALCVAMETSKNTISTWNFFEDFFSMKHDTFLILKLLIKFLKELVVGQGLFSAKSPCLMRIISCCYYNCICVVMKFLINKKTPPCN